MACFMKQKDLYGACIEYHHEGVYDYKVVLLDKWHRVMSVLDSFVKDSTDAFVASFYEQINGDLEGNLGDYIEEFGYLEESTHPCDAIKLVVNNEIKRSNYEPGTPYKQRGYWQFLEWALDGVHASKDSWFDIQCEGPYPEFISKWYKHLSESHSVYPQVIGYNPKQPISSKDYEILGKLSLFLKVFTTEENGDFLRAISLSSTIISLISVFFVTLHNILHSSIRFKT